MFGLLALSSAGFYSLNGTSIVELAVLGSGILLHIASLGFQLTVCSVFAVENGNSRLPAQGHHAGHLLSCPSCLDGFYASGSTILFIGGFWSGQQETTNRVGLRSEVRADWEVWVKVGMGQGGSGWMG